VCASLTAAYIRIMSKETSSLCTIIMSKETYTNGERDTQETSKRRLGAASWRVRPAFTQKSPTSSPESPAFTQKSHIFTQESPILTQKSPAFCSATQKSPTSIQERPVFTQSTQKSPTFPPKSPTFTQKIFQNIYILDPAQKGLDNVVHHLVFPKSALHPFKRALHSPNSPKRALYSPKRVLYSPKQKHTANRQTLRRKALTMLGSRPAFPQKSPALIQKSPIFTQTNTYFQSSDPAQKGPDHVGQPPHAFRTRTILIGLVSILKSQLTGNKSQNSDHCEICYVK